MTGPLTLGLDTSAEVTVGLARGSEVLGSATWTDRRAHVEQLLPLVRRVCREAGVAPTELDRVVVGLGPGPFTGLRVGIATAQLVAATLRVTFRGVCSLDVLACAYAAERPDREFVVVTDARRREVYWARYAAEGRRLDGPRVGLATEVPPLPAVGPGTDLYPHDLTGVLGPRALDPAVLVVHGFDLPDAGRAPLYLRRPDAAEPTRRKSVLPRIWR